MGAKSVMRVVIITALLLVAMSAQAEELCYGREYSAAHLAKHPDQLVTAMQLKIYDEPKFTPPKGWAIKVFKRGRKDAVLAAGLCGEAQRPGRSHLHCFGECDGGSFEVQFTGTNEMLLRLDRLRVSSECGGEEEVEELLSGVDDKVFRLDRLPVSACGRVEALNR